MSPTLLIQMMLILVGLALVGLGVSASDLVVMAAGNLFLSALGFYHLWLCISRPQRHWSFCDLQAGALLASYTGGITVAFMLAEVGLLRAYTAPKLDTLSAAIAYVLLFFATLRFVGKFENRLWVPVWKLMSDARPWPVYIALGVALIVVLQVFLIMSGAITYGGAVAENPGVLPMFPALVVALSWPLAGISGWVLGHEVLRRVQLYFWGALALLPVQFLFIMGYGRRALALQAAAFVIGFIWARGRGFTLRQVAWMSVIGIPVLYVLWMLFLGLRIDAYSDRNANPNETRTLFDRIGSTSEYLDENWDYVQSVQAENLVTRVMVIDYLSDLIEGTRPASATYGEQLVAQAISAIPRVILPSKDELLRDLPLGEDDINPRFGLQVTDRADSIVTSGYIDFLWFGPVLMALVALAVGAMMALLARTGNSPFFAAFVVFYVLVSATSIENFFLTFQLNVIRLLIPLAGVFLFLAVLTGSPARRPDFTKPETN